MNNKDSAKVRQIGRGVKLAELYIFSYKRSNMQDEVTKHTEKIYRAMKNKEHSFLEKVKDVAVEIFIIVFAVTLSIWLHNWSDHRREQSETDEFLTGLKSDLAKDVRLLEDNKRTFARVDSDFTYLYMLTETRAIDTASDKLIAHHLNYSLNATHANVGRYEGFKSSGKIGAIESDSLKQSILVYYQQTIPGVDDREELVNSFQARILDLEVGRTEKKSLASIVKTFKMHAFLELAIENLGVMIRTYDSAQLDAKKIMVMIDEYPRR
jgi:hypothetical protein